MQTGIENLWQAMNQDIASGTAVSAGWLLRLARQTRNARCLQPSNWQPNAEPSSFGFPWIQFHPGGAGRGARDSTRSRSELTERSTSARPQGRTIYRCIYLAG